MGQIRWTLEAERWLREIYDYIARDNPAAALRMQDGDVTILGVFHGALDIDRYLAS